MPNSKNPHKKTISNKLSENVIDLAPKPRGMNGTMASGHDSRSKDSLDQAQHLMYDAWECTVPKQRIALAKKALKISPLCADAYNLLALESAKTPDEALALYRRAVVAGSEALGPDGFEEYAEEFWGNLEPRPYMRARAGLGHVLWAIGDKEDAIENFKEMLELNPRDHQGIRSVLAEKLLDMGKLDDLKVLLKIYEYDYSVDIQYTRALIAFSEGADIADDIAKVACQINKHVPAILSGKKRRVWVGATVKIGGEDEASSYVEGFARAWKQTQGAIDWLSKVTESLPERNDPR